MARRITLVTSFIIAIVIASFGWHLYPRRLDPLPATRMSIEIDNGERVRAVEMTMAPLDSEGRWYALGVMIYADHPQIAELPRITVTNGVAGECSSIPAVMKEYFMFLADFARELCGAGFQNSGTPTFEGSWLKAVNVDPVYGKVRADFNASGAVLVISGDRVREPADDSERSGNFSFTKNGLDARIALPNVRILNRPEGQVPVLYSVAAPGMGEYAWSGNSEVNAEDSIMWSYLVDVRLPTLGESTGRNRRSQEEDNRHLFFSGILIGSALSLALGILQLTPQSMRRRNNVESMSQANSLS